MSDKLSIGDTLTIGGVREMIPNPARQWWQFWRPRLVEGVNLARFAVTEEYSFPTHRIWTGYGR